MVAKWRREGIQAGQCGNGEADWEDSCAGREAGLTLGIEDREERLDEEFEGL